MRSAGYDTSMTVHHHSTSGIAWLPLSRAEAQPGSAVRVLTGSATIDGTLGEWGLTHLTVWAADSEQHVIDIVDGLFAVFAPDHRVCGSVSKVEGSKAVSRHGLDPGLVEELNYGVVHEIEGER